RSAGRPLATAGGRLLPTLGGPLTPLVVLPHPLRIAHQRHVVDRDRHAVGEPARGLRTLHPPPGPFAVMRHQDHSGFRHCGAGFEERLHSPPAPDKLLQVREILSGGWTVPGGSLRLPLLASPEPGHRDLSLPSTLRDRRPVADPPARTPPPGRADVLSASVRRIIRPARPMSHHSHRSRSGAETDLAASAGADSDKMRATAAAGCGVRCWEFW